MKIIEPKVEEVKDFEGVDNFYKAVAMAARICYASDKTDNDKELVERLIKLGHFSPFEHAIINVYVHKMDSITCKNKVWDNIMKSKYVVFTCNSEGFCNIASINGRIIVEAILNTKSPINKGIDYLDNILYQIKDCEVTDFCPVFKSFIVDTSIGCTREMNRHHDNFYICEQSTRYCNFSKDKFGNEIAFNKPYWWNDNPPHNYVNLSQEEYEQELWKQSMQQAEDMYIKALNNDMSTDMARGILPLDTHTRAIYTATISEWHHFIDLRFKGTTGKPHGDIMIIEEKINNIINKQ